MSNEEKPVFKKGYNETYYFTDPEKLKLNHFLDKKEFQFADNSIDKRTFRKQPLFLSDYLADTIQEVSPNISLLKAKAGDRLLFRLKTEKRINSMYAFSEIQKKAGYRELVNYNNGWIEFYYPVTVKGYYELYIGYYYGITGNKTLLAYRLDVK